MNDESREQNSLNKNERNKRLAIAAAAMAVAACAVILACRPDYRDSLLTGLSSAFSADQTAKAVQLTSSASVPSTPSSAASTSSAASASSASPASSEASAASSAASSSQENSSAAAPNVSLVTVPPQISLEDAARPLWIDVSIAAQRVTVFDANRMIVKQFVCSTGSPGNDTPTGTFRIQDRGKSFYNKDSQEGGYYWTQFYGDYLFHSVPFDKNQNLKPEEAAKIGTPASHGCVRLLMDDAKWIYDNIPRGTVVLIHKDN
ncbi:L,D-transpeptidase [Thermocaproicibacter melissae]|jgi:lipoprotein-anchoring transpeptidase ErfK/SrfK|uniref:L,D-transpeptidase n=1 Tax=Thermocaproicibacter melissae TaxID=2966552 RepID=UPI0024B21762|nr:L,D-transpeptidase [Thermocaproicibacter melissae]WBY63723.1 L,D-transpeptidase [Thermocaproicibacter melissae]